MQDLTPAPLTPAPCLAAPTPGHRAEHRHLKADHRMDRCWFKGSEGDVLHAVLCAAGFNIRWLLRAIAARGSSLALSLLLALRQLAVILDIGQPQPLLSRGTSLSLSPASN